MTLHIFEKCWRGRDDCVALDAIDAAPADITEEQFFERTYEPLSFVCCGCIKPEHREDVQQDCFRICWKNGQVDEMGDYDEQDITHTMRVMSNALAILASRRAKTDTLTIMTPDGLETVQPTQPEQPAYAGRAEEAK